MRFRLNAALLAAILLTSGFAVAATSAAPSANPDKGKVRTVSEKVKNKATAAKVAKPTKQISAKTKGSSAALVSTGRVRHAVSATESWQDAKKLAVHSASALVFDQHAGDALFQKNADAVSPIASITKLMMAMVVLDSAPDLQAPIAIAEEDVDMLRGSRSRLQVGSVLSRETALLLALMSSENRAAHALARHYSGGLGAFVAAMNAKAQALGMTNTRFEDPTGLSSNNVSTAHDLARMVSAAYRYPLIREWSTTSEATVDISGRELAFRNTNPLVKSPSWDVGLSKTGYIHEAGKCLVMQARVAEKPVVIVLLDSVGKLTRVGDANRIKRWMESAQAARKAPTHATAPAAPPHFSGRVSG